MTQSQKFRELLDLTMSNNLKILYGWWLATRDTGVFVRKMREMADNLDDIYNRTDKQCTYGMGNRHD